MAGNKDTFQTLHRALQHHQSGRLAEAEQLYQQILAEKPNDPDALHHLGMIAGQRGQYDAAIDLISRAVAIKSEYPEAWSNLGNALRSKERLDEAIAAYRKAIALRPNYAVAHTNLGGTLKDKGQTTEAIACHRRAIELDATEPLFHCNLGIALKVQDKLDEAIAAYRTALSLQPDYADALFNLGAALSDDGQLDAAIDAYHQAIAHKPAMAEAHWNLALSLLARGDFVEGWAQHQWRWECPGLPKKRKFPQPEWDGSPLNGRTILLHPEQGHGDTLQFIRYAPLVAERGGTVLVGSVPELHRLLIGVAGVSRWIASGETLPPFDTHCPMMTLPAVLGTTIETIPQSVPYINADPAEIARWRQRIAACSRSGQSPLRVGICWAGSAVHVNDRNRSISLAALAPLAKVPGVIFFSLQKGEPAMQAKTPPPGMELIDLTDELNDFADTAAMIANLDLIISVDTSVVHLAGAMGLLVWTLLPFTTDWRWLLDRSDSPWYPSMRLFRQSSRGDWGSVIDRVIDALTICVGH